MISQVIADLPAHSLAAHALADGNTYNIFDPVNFLKNPAIRSLILPIILAFIFIETGLLFPFLPGDSLLFAAGMLAGGDVGNGETLLNIWAVVPAVVIIAFLGDQSGYWLGRKVGRRLFKPDARILKTEYLEQSQEFFDRHGPKTIILCRFVPIVRTFAPVVAGLSEMKYRTYLAWDIVGALLWGGGVTLLGYFFGGLIPEKAVEPVFIAIIVLSLIPPFVGWIKKRRATKAEKAVS